jgi:hypothetical protein
MSDAQDRIAHLAAEARSRADVAGTQAAWQEGRAHGLREAAAITATAANARTLRDDIRDYIADLTARGTPPGKQPGHRLLLLSPSQLAIGEAAAVAKRAAWRQVAEDLRGLLAANEPEEAES